MKGSRSVCLVLIALIVACSSQDSVSSFEFSDSHGRTYQSESAAKDLSAQYSFPSPLKFVVVATDSLSSDEFLQQLSVLESMDSESIGFAYIIASTEPVEKYGYHTDSTTAQRLLESESFKVIGLGSGGDVRWIKNELTSARFIEANFE